MAGEGVGDHADDARIDQVVGTHVDAHPGIRQQRLEPGQQPARLIGDRTVDLGADARFERHVEEVGRPEHATARVVPAHERLEPAQRAVGDAHHRLQVRHHLASLHRPAQHAGEFTTLGPTTHLRDRTAAPGSLDLVHGLIRLGEQRPHGGCRIRVRHPDRGRDRGHAAAQHERFGNRLLGTATELLDGRARPEARRQHHELVTSDASDGVAESHETAKPLGDRDQQLVAGVVAEQVVHGLEAVEIDEQQADLIGVAASHERLADRVRQRDPVR